MFDQPRQMEPMFPNETPDLLGLATAVLRSSATLEGSLNPVARGVIIKLLRHINSYYSNRIEGEHTTPADIEMAVKNEFSSDENKRRLQLLSIAHIEVQDLIDHWIQEEPSINICTEAFLCKIHHAFYSRVPESFLQITHPVSGDILVMVPGALRNHEVKIGLHVPPKATSLSSFLDHFSHAYNPNNLVGHRKVLAAAASHHRFAWIHPFLDGNGRVGRLFSYAYMKRTQLESFGLWTLSRGFARRADEYIYALAVADEGRVGALDGRGNLTEAGLRRFCEFYLTVAHDQITFMSELLQLENLRQRIAGYVHLRSQNLLQNELPLRIEAKYVLMEVLTAGELSRREAHRVSGLAERTSRDLVSQLEKEELVVSKNHKSPLRFNIPSKVLGYYFPSLYPDGMI